MVIQSNNCKGCDSEIKKSVKLGGVLEKKCLKILVPRYWNTSFGGKVVICNKSSQNTLVSIYVRDFGTNLLP